MRLSSASSASPEQRKNGRSGMRLRKKHKKLDAICEKEYNRHHSELTQENVGGGALGNDSELRRSSRVRRAPVLLDASPPPPKKRRKSGKNAVAGDLKDVKDSELVHQNSSGVETPGTWGSRLRSRVKNESLIVKEDVESPRGKRKLFEVMDRSRDEKVEIIEIDKKDELEGGMPKIMKSKRPGRIKATKHAEGPKNNESHGNLDENKSQEVELMVKKAEDNTSVIETEDFCGNVIEIEDENADPTAGNVGRNNNMGSVDCNGSVELSHVEPLDKQVDGLESANEGIEGSDKQVDELESAKEGIDGSDKQVDQLESAKEEIDGNDKEVVQLESVKEGIDGSDVLDAVGVPTKEVENEIPLDKQDSDDAKTLDDANNVNREESKQASNVPVQPRIKEGRHCSLCGGGTDGRPPKRFVQDNCESENEAYSGSSASEEPNYDIWDGFGDEPGWLGRLLGPINDRYGIAGIWVHQHCAVWSPEVYFAGLGCLKNVRAALCRGRALKCTRCGRRGATIGCRVDRCPKTYHLPCARANGCIFDHRKFLIACTDHRHLFQPHGIQYLARLKKLKARKMKLEMRKLSNDAWRKDIEAEERWLENCGEDEEFLKRESKRLHRDLVRIAPIYVGGSESNNDKSFQGWESVAGLKDVIQCMKEVVILPLLYPEFFDNLGLTPPRGVLLHGYPGTGKTLVVRALIGACARGNKRIAYFARKGADCLGKYVGDAERQLRLLFQVAEKCQPSIIFFDEIDGLAPCRTRRQDQTHSSVVSTLLALMDGLKSRGSVVVIGATNRPDAVDPALRRPGRFDREIYFPLPSVEDRASILSLHTQRWPKPITGSLLQWIARKTPGFAGADLQALCTQAAMNALKRNFPLQEMLSETGDRGSGCNRPPLPSFAVEERDWLEALLYSQPPCSRREAGIAANDVVCSPLPLHLVPCLLRPLCTLLVSLYLDEHLWLPPPISKAITMIKNVMISALDKKKMSVDQWWSHVDEFLQEANIAADVEKKLTCSGILFASDAFAGSHHLVDDIGDERVKCEPSRKHHVGTHGNLLPGLSFALTNKSGFRILIDGNPRAGQKHLASCLLYCFIGNLEIQKIDMATISQEGHGDVLHGIAQILMKCASMQSCIVFLPRIDLWAVEAQFQVDENTDSCPTSHKLLEMEESYFKQSQLVGKDSECNTEERKSPEMAQGQVSRGASYAWMSFLEQVQSIGVSTSLMILATSEVPCHDLPFKIREFFGSDNCRFSQSTPLNPAVVSHFSLQIDGNFDHDAVINLSAAELMRNILEQLVQLIHQRSHVHVDSQKGYQTHDSIKDGRDIDCHREDNRSANENKGGIQLPESFTKVMPPPNSRSLKGKSTLLLAISNLGYQILRYPQFAELCWVTSKLREGPSADVIGPRKGWPFNSCIIRPNDSQDWVAVSYTSGNIKSKERSGLVRGLVAVGLSAYKGAYTSVRQVSLEVRKVLEILVRQINTKVQAGKDRYQYIRVLSQVAYLEDMVNNWAYALQSLEWDSPEHVAKTMPPSFESSDNHHNPCEDNQVQDENCQLNVPMEGNEPERLERSLEEIAAEASGCLAPNDQNGDLHNLNHDGGVEVSEGSTLQHSLSDKHIDNGTAASTPVNPIVHENGTPSGLSELGTAGNHGVVDGEFGTLKDLNESTHTNSIAIREDELHCTQEPDSVKLGNSNEVSDQVLSLSSAETGVKLSDINSGIDGNATDINVSSSKGSDPADTESGVICSYQFCPGCLRHLYDLMQKLLVQKWGLSNSHLTVEDVHDAVASLSVDLISAVRKFYRPLDLNDLSDKSLRHEKQGTPLECLNLRTSNPRNLDSIVVPVQCGSHCIGQEATTSKDASLNEPPKLDMKFIFRDGVLVHMDPDKDASLHCKFENLCICSLGELLIVKTKRPLG